MSRHGPPSRPGDEEFGPPSDPWGRASYRPDEEPGGYPPPGYEPGGYAPGGYEPGYERGYERGGYGPGPAGYEPGYEPGYDRHGDFEDPGYEQPPYREPVPDDDDLADDRPAPPAGRPIGLYALVAVLVIFAASGVGYALYLLTSNDGEPPDQDPIATGDPTGTPDPDATGDNLGLNAAMARPDDCLVNDGSADIPQLRIVACDSEDEQEQVFQVLEVFDERVEGEGEAANEQAQSICADTDGYTHHYYEVGIGEASSFVLCMAELD